MSGPKVQYDLLDESIENYFEYNKHIFNSKLIY